MVQELINALCAALNFFGDILAQIYCGISVSQDQGVKIYGSEGYI